MQLKKRSNLKTSMYLYLANLDKEIIAPDFSEEKLKNVSILKLELPKFKGYNSSIDYYTFKTEFDFTPCAIKIVVGLFKK